jgi:hypothetical protein
MVMATRRSKIQDRVLPSHKALGIVVGRWILSCIVGDVMLASWCRLGLQILEISRLARTRVRADNRR